MLEAMRNAGVALTELRVDGGAAAMDLLCQSLADGTRPRRAPTGVARGNRDRGRAIAGLAVGAL